MKDQNTLRMSVMLNRNALVTHVFALLLLAGSDVSLAQSIAEPPPVREWVDANGVDLMTGRMTGIYRGPSTGPSGSSLQFSRNFHWSTSGDSYLGVIVANGTEYQVGLGASSEKFIESGGAFTATENTGSTLSLNGSTYTYTTRSGAVATFHNRPAIYAYPAANGSLTTLTYPNGERLTAEYENATICTVYQSGQGCTSWKTAVRIKTLTSNYGYRLAIGYAANLGPNQIAGWLFIQPNEVVLSNLVDGTVVGSVDISTSFIVATQVVQFTDDLGRVTTYTITNDGIASIRRPGSAVDNVTVNYSEMVSSVTSDGMNTTYTYSDVGTDPIIRTTTVTRAGIAQRVATFDLSTGQMLTDRDELNRTTTYEYNAQGRLFRVTAPEGNLVEYTYDARGNVTQTLLNAKPSSSLSDIITTAGFDATCTNPKTCNQPNWTRDAKGNQTDYTYDSTHGGVLTVTLPAPSSGAVRPQTRFAYAALEAWYLNTSGVLAASGQPIYLLTEVSTCRILSTCAGTNDESKTTIGYGSAGVPNNRWPVTVESRNGTGSLVSTVTTTYDSAGNVLTVDGPLVGNADSRRTRYDALRRVVGTIGPDPDAAGARKPVAVRNTYNTAGHLVLVERGTVDSQSEADWTSFSAAESVSLAHDATGRRTQSSLVASGTTYAVEQISYDTLGRTECVATRMNPTTFGALPSACQLATTGSHGPDRIRRFTYNAAHEVTKVTEGYDTANPIDVTTTTYTTNGRIATVADGKGNLTTYDHDGFDRLFKTRFPDASSPASSSTTDYEQLAYDANSNVMSGRARSGQVMNFTWNDLDRLAVKDLPGGSGEDVYFAYDNHGRMLSARYGSTSGDGIVLDYDGLGRLASRATFGWTLSYNYDAASRRTRITHPDAFYAEYTYSAAHELTSVSDSAGVTLAILTYDALGRRSGIDRANGTSTIFDYDPVSRLVSLVQDLTGTAHDSTVGFAYAPSAQIISRTQSNDAAYTWVPGTSGSVSKTHNGLNQLTQTGSTSVTHDDLGNLETGESSFTYGFDNENRFRSAEAGITAVSLVYDPLGMLHQITRDGTSRQFLYDGVDLVAEYDGEVLLRRYVHGPGLDEPLVWYEGSGTTDRRYLHADERGSIVAISNNSGTATVSFKYSPDGESINAASSRFGYTGQVWLAEVGLHYYKSRVYSSKVGRFLQPDAIGYAGGPNLYAYVGGDPINWVDPYGLSRCAWVPDVIDQTCTTGTRFYDTFVRDLYFLDLIEAGRDADGGGGDGAGSQKQTPPCEEELDDDSWSARFGGYLGVGGELIFGQDLGSHFVTLRIGFGLGGGVSWSPMGSAPGPAIADRNRGGFVLSDSARAAFSYATLGTSLEGGVARNYANSESAFYGDRSASARGRSGRGASASASIAAQATYYTKATSYYRDQGTCHL